MTKSYLTVKEVAQMLNRSVGTVRNWCSQGKIPYKKVLGKNMFEKSVLEKWLESQDLSSDGDESGDKTLDTLE